MPRLREVTRVTPALLAALLSLSPAAHAAAHALVAKNEARCAQIWQRLKVVNDMDPKKEPERQALTKEWSAKCADFIPPPSAQGLGIRLPAAPKLGERPRPGFCDYWALEWKKYRSQITRTNMLANSCPDPSSKRFEEQLKAINEAPQRKGVPDFR
jgi:hypothetical protein